MWTIYESWLKHQLCVMTRHIRGASSIPNSTHWTQSIFLFVISEVLVFIGTIIQKSLVCFYAYTFSCQNNFVKIYETVDIFSVWRVRHFKSSSNQNEIYVNMILHEHEGEGAFNIYIYMGFFHTSFRIYLFIHTVTASKISRKRLYKNK